MTMSTGAFFQALHATVITTALKKLTQAQRDYLHKQVLALEAENTKDLFLAVDRVAGAHHALACAGGRGDRCTRRERWLPGIATALPRRLG